MAREAETRLPEATSGGFSPQAVVLYSKGMRSYVMCCLFQLHEVMPRARIVFISDVNPGIDFVEHVDSRMYDRSFEQFSKLYEHLSTNEDWFERVCFYRWFVIRDWMRSAGVDRIVHLDTDVLLYRSIESLGVSVPVGGFGIVSTVHGAFSPHVLLVESVSAMEAFCAFCCEMYENAVRLRVLRDFYEAKRQRNEAGGVCDMYAFGWVTGWRGGCDQVIPKVELNLPEVYGFAIDASINDNQSAVAADYFKMAGGVKVVQRSASGGFQFINSAGAGVPVAAVHCQGGAKSLMRELMTHKRFSFHCKFLPLIAREVFVLYVRKAQRGMRRGLRLPGWVIRWLLRNVAR